MAFAVIIAAWLWVSAEEYQEFGEQTSAIVPVQPPTVDSTVVEDDIDTTAIKEPEPQHGWIVPPKQVRKTAGRVKQKIKKSVAK